MEAAGAAFRRVRKHKIAAGAVAALGVAAYGSFAYVGPDQFALRETLGSIDPTLMKSTIGLQVPFAQFTHRYRVGTQRINFPAGSTRFPTIPGLPLTADTGDQNLLIANMALNYQVVPDVQKLTYWRWEMRDWGAPDGYWVITGFLNDSTNAVLGRQPMAATLSDPSSFTRDVYKDFLLRLKQNNVPVYVESLELQSFTTSRFVPTKTRSYRVIGPKAAAAAAAPQ